MNDTANGHSAIGVKVLIRALVGYVTYHSLTRGDSGIRSPPATAALLYEHLTSSIATSQQSKSLHFVHYIFLARFTALNTNGDTQNAHSRWKRGWPNGLWHYEYGFSSTFPWFSRDLSILTPVQE